jgi:CheY-like chemotaxis protein
MPSKILVIDSEAGMRQVIAKMLIPLGHTLLEADDAARGLELCRKEHPAAVLLDIRLPDMDAADILAELKKINRDMPVIVLTGFGDVDAAPELVKQGAFGQLSKPFKVDNFLSIVNKALASPAPAVPAKITDEKKAETEKGKPPVTAGRKIPAWIFAAALFLVLACGAGYYYMSALVPDPVQFTIEYSNPSALYYAGGSLWSADWVEGKVYRQETVAGKDLRIISRYALSEIQPTGIAYDGRNIWVSSSLEGKIYKLSGDATLAVTASFQSPGPSPSGLLFEDGGLWSLDFQSAKVYKHKLDDQLTVVSTFDSPAKNPCGVFSIKQGLCIADASTGRIYCVNRDDFALRGIYTLARGEDIKISSAASDGENIWICSDGTAKIYRFSVKSLKTVKL